MLSAQGFSKLCWILGHEAWVFHVLANAVAVPSIIPLMTLKSSVWILLKFPQRPVEKQWKVYTAHTWQKTLSKMFLYFIHLPQVWSLKIGSSRTNTCMMGMIWISRWTPKFVCMMMKNDEGLNTVTLATDEKQNDHFLNEVKCWKQCIIIPLFLNSYCNCCKFWGQIKPIFMKMNEKSKSKFAVQNSLVATKLLTLFAVSTLSSSRLLLPRE